MNPYHRNEQRNAPRHNDRERSDRPQNYGSARSDYGNLAYGGRLNKTGGERGWWDRATDEVSSWFGDGDAERRREMDERYNNANSGYASRDHPGGSVQQYWGMEPPSYLSRTNEDDPKAREVMTHDVVRVHPTDSLQYAARLMDGYDCGALPVVDWQNRLIGMITDRDIAVRGVAVRRNASTTPVADVMTEEAFACHVNDSLKNCMRSMSRHQVRRIPIVNDHNRVVGIVSQADIATHASKNSYNGERRAVADVVRAVSEPTDRPYR